MLEIKRRDNAVVVTMNRPPVNAFDQDFVAAWHRVLDQVAASEVAVMHLRSAARVFSAGADLKMMREFFAGADAADRLIAHVAQMQAVFNRIEALPCVTLAEIGGSALGGGLELALSCDLRLAGHGAVLGLPEARIGLIPGAGGTQRLTRLLGGAVSRRIILGGDTVDGRAAEALGLVQWSVADGDLAAAAADRVVQIARMSAGALAASKRCIAVAEPGIAAGLQEELRETKNLLNTTDTRARVRAFLEK